jgi:hypothetical protein
VTKTRTVTSLSTSTGSTGTTVIATATTSPVVTATTTSTSIKTQIDVPTITVTTEYFETSFSISTLTTTITSVTTSTVSACTETSYHFQVVGGTYNGQYIYNTDPTNPQTTTYNFVQVGATLATAHQYVIQANGHVKGPDNLYGWATINSNYYYVLSESDSSQAAYGTPYITCSVEVSPSLNALVPTAAGQLACSRSDGQATYLISCPNVNGVIYQAPQANALGGPCVPLTIAAIPFGINSC